VKSDARAVAIEKLDPALLQSSLNPHEAILFERCFPSLKALHAALAQAGSIGQGSLRQPEHSAGADNVFWTEFHFFIDLASPCISICRKSRQTLTIFKIDRLKPAHHRMNCTPAPRVK
jgi:hypothetical protein